MIDDCMNNSIVGVGRCLRSVPGQNADALAGHLLDHIAELGVPGRRTLSTVLTRIHSGKWFGI